jgi:hypothetical protein
MLAPVKVFVVVALLVLGAALQVLGTIVIANRWLDLKASWFIFRRRALVRWIRMSDEIRYLVTRHRIARAGTATVTAEAVEPWISTASGDVRDDVEALRVEIAQVRHRVRRLDDRMGHAVKASIPGVVILSAGVASSVAASIIALVW